MALRNSWKDIIDGESEIVGENINDIAHAVIDVEDGKEDKANKIQSIDALMNDEQYLSAAGTRALASTAEYNAKAHADGLYSKLNQRVTTNEESIAGAFGAIQSVESRVGDLEVAESDLQGRMIAVEDKTAELERDIETCGDFELVDSGTLAEDVAQVSPTINGQYKELYIFLKMPAQADVATNTLKARVRMKIGNINIYDQGNFMVTNYNADWYMVCTVKAYGTRCYSQVWFGKYYTDNNGVINPYAINASTADYNGAIVPHVNLNNPYLDSFTVSMASNPAGGRYFPNGTTYELWGVKA